MMHSKRTVAIVYDWLDSWGGVERVLLQIHSLFPEADWYTSYFDHDKAHWFSSVLNNDDSKLKTSFLETLPSFIKKNRSISLSLYPYAFESFHLSQYDLVISVTSAFAKSVITRPDTRHICYLLTPPRYLWSHQSDYVSKMNQMIFRPFINKLKKWDVIAAQRPDLIISLSKTVAERCKNYYQRESKVLYPPFDEVYWRDKIKGNLLANDLPVAFDNYYLIVSRLVPYKKVDLVVQAFSQMPHKNLIVVGVGSQLEHLRSQANENTVFIQDISDKQLAVMYKKADALILPQEEDFGYVSLEAQFFGCPVIAYKKGGATETVQESKTGIFFHHQTVEDIVQAIEILENKKESLQQNLKNYKIPQKLSLSYFKQKFLEYAQTS